MIGNFSFEEHDRYFTRMYNHLRFIDRSLDITTIINIIKCKVILEQEQENIMHNLNIKNIFDTPMIKDFKIWSSQIRSPTVKKKKKKAKPKAKPKATKKKAKSQSEDESEAQSEDEDSEVQNGEDENDYSGVEEFRRNYRNSEAQRYSPKRSSKIQ